MILSLRLQNFRSYTDKTFEFYPEANIIVGPNAIGKTNIIEAILLSTVGRSYRAKDVDLIAHTKPWARIETKDSTGTRVIKIAADQNPAKTFEINDQVYKRLPASLKLPIVLFEPNHLQLLNGSPEGRRSYLDEFIEQTSQEYGPILRKYSRALSQRNSLLKNYVRPTNSQLFPWNIRVSQLGGQIVIYRQKLVEEINKVLPDIYKSLSGDKIKTSVVYKPQLPAEGYETSYLKKLESNLDEDLRTGFTAYGPHRDDFVFMFNNHPSNAYASRGELRTAILALKVTELETLKNNSSVSPVILLDDVYSELDNSRRQSLTAYLKSNQSFITTTDADQLSKQLASSAKLIKL
ncbi:MAG TPA: DNA replication and repair protein RecF [Candidatus Saccharimonadales bacterium]|jgi:DNA replication and repair protein RecF